MALKNFSQFTPQTVLSATDFVVGYRSTDEIRTDLDSLAVGISGILISKGFTPGGNLGSVRRVNYRYTITNNTSPLNAVSGVDDYGRTLTYTAGQIDVYRNGVHLVENLDFVASNTTQITNLSTMNVGDVVDVIALSAAGITLGYSISGYGSVFQNNYRYTVNPANTVKPGATIVAGADDIGKVLTYAAPNLDVYLNGSHLVNGLDYQANDNSTVIMTEGLSSGDIVDVSTISAYNVGGMAFVTGGVTKINAGAGIIINPSNGLGEVTITGNTFQLTGGNIVIPIGSTRTYKKFSTAFYSMSSYILDQANANVIFVVDPEIITETEPITLNHQDGEFMTLSGSIQPGFVAKATSPGTNSPITSVAYTTGGALSATIQFDNTITNPQPGNYIQIWSVSGAEARQIVSPYTADGSGNPVVYSSNVPVSEYGNYGFLTSGCPVIYYRQASSTSWPSFSARIVLVDSPTSVTTRYTLGSVADTSGSTSLAGFAGTASWFMDTGTPESFKGNRISSVSLNTTLSSSTLTFSDSRATNTYLNEGDLLLVLGQVFPVTQVGATNTCVIQGCIRFPSATGWNRTSFPSGGLYYLVNSRIDYYTGTHKVVARPTANTVTIEISQNVCVDPTAAKLGSGRTLFPPPRYGVSQLGDGGTNYNVGTSFNSVLKSVIKYSPSSEKQFINIFGHTFAQIKNIAFEATRPLRIGVIDQYYSAIRLGASFDSTVNTPASITLTNVAFQNFFPTALSLYNNSTISLNQVSINSGLSSFGFNTGSAIAIYANNGIVDGTRVAINGGIYSIYSYNSSMRLQYVYCKNVSNYWTFVSSTSQMYIVNSIFNNLGAGDPPASGYTGSDIAYDTRGLAFDNSQLEFYNNTVIGGMNQGWLFQTGQINGVFSRCCLWEMPNPIKSSYGVAFYNGGSMQVYYTYHVGNSMIDGGSFNYWMDQASDSIYGFCVAVGTNIGWYLQDGSKFTEYNSNTSFRNNVAMFCDNGIYTSNNVSFRLNLQNFRNTTYSIWYTGYLNNGVSTNTVPVGYTTLITGVTQNIAPDANGNYLAYS